MQINEVMSYIVFGNTVRSYMAAGLFFIVIALVLKFLEMFTVSKLKVLSKKTKNRLDDALVEAIENVGWPFYILVSLYIALQPLTLPDFAKKMLRYIGIIVVTYYALRFINRIIDFCVLYLIEKRSKKQQDGSSIKLMGKIIRGVLWMIAILLIIQNMGYNVSALVAGLGIGGVAVAFALQNILGDIFASFSIYFDKPFEVGDFIIVGNDMGVVKKIGIKTTRIQALQGQETIMSNTALTQSTVHNYKKMKERRAVFSVGIAYDTPVKKIKKVPIIIKEVMKKIDGARLDRAHFQKFGDFSLIFEIVYYIASSDYNQYMDVQQALNLAIKERFEKEKIEFAYPTQTIILGKA